MSEAAYRLFERQDKPYKPEFKADTATLKNWLNKRKKSLEAVRQEFESLWKDIRLYFEPNIGKALLDVDDRDDAASKREDSKIINSEPRLCVQRYGAGMQSGITNKAQPWCSIVPKGIDDKLSRDPRINSWCNIATTEILAALERGNFYRTSGQVYPHAALLGTSCIMIFRGDALGDVSFKLIDEGDYWIAEDKYGEVTTLLRRISMTLEQASQEFFLGALPEKWRAMIKDGKLEERVTVYNLICPNEGGEHYADIPEERPYASFYWCPPITTQDSDGILDIRSYTYKPFAVLRQIDSGSVYGKSIGEMTLADNKELQELEEYELRMIANEATPSMLAPSSMKGKPINQFPGGVTYYDAVLGVGSSPVTRLFETREGIDKVDAKIQIISDRIGRFWYNDLFAMMLQVNANNRAQKTATEVAELSGEKVTLLGPVLTQTDDFLTSVIDAVFTILYADGIIPEAPYAITQGDAEISVEYTSTIHAEMKAALKMRAINSLIQMAAMLAQIKPEAIDKVNCDEVIDETCKVYPGAAAYIYTSKEVAQIREARNLQQQQMIASQQYLELAKTAGANAKALSETNVGNGNALEMLMGGAA